MPTSTTIDKLHKGDRFYFTTDTDKLVYQITQPTNNTNIHPRYNIIDDKGISKWQFDKVCRNPNKTVVVLRNSSQQKQN